MKKLKDAVIAKLSHTLTEIELDEVTMNDEFFEWCEGLREVIVDYVDKD